MECSAVLWDQLQIVMKIFGTMGEGKVSLLRHINRKFIVNVYQVVKFRKTIGCSGDLEYRECIQRFG